MLSGTVADFRKAFDVELLNYESPADRTAAAAAPFTSPRNWMASSPPSLVSTTVRKRSPIFASTAPP